MNYQFTAVKDSKHDYIAGQGCEGRICEGSLWPAFCIHRQQASFHEHCLCLHVYSCLHLQLYIFSVMSLYLSQTVFGMVHETMGSAQGLFKNVGTFYLKSMSLCVSLVIGQYIYSTFFCWRRIGVFGVLSRKALSPSEYIQGEHGHLQV